MGLETFEEATGRLIADLVDNVITISEFCERFNPALDSLLAEARKEERERLLSVIRKHITYLPYLAIKNELREEG